VKKNVEIGSRDSMDFDQLRCKVSARSPGESVWIPKSELPSLPPEFSQTLLGTPLWIAHPGATAQHRATPAMHAYETDEGWWVHRDKCDPGENPVGHFFFDAPELPIATFAAAVAGVLTYLFLDGRERDKDEYERNPWFPALVAIGVATIVGIVVYVLAALARVAFGVG
jgi:hypothetical protein